MFIVFEGIDGCGKSTQIFLLAKYLSNLNKYYHVLITREPYKDREIREILKINEKPEEKSEKLTELFIQDRKEHIESIILPNIAKNVIVISDRYKYSTIAYQAAQGQDINMLIEKQKEFPVPDIIFIIDASIETAVKRMSNEKSIRGEQKFEKSREFQDKVRQNYLKLKELLPNENIIIINGEKSIEEIFQEIKPNLKV